MRAAGSTTLLHAVRNETVEQQQKSVKSRFGGGDGRARDKSETLASTTPAARVARARLERASRGANLTADRQTTCAVHACSCSAEEAANKSLYLPLPLQPASCHTPPLQHHSPRGAVRATRDRGACLYLERRAGRGWEGYGMVWWRKGGREGGINRVDDDYCISCKTTASSTRSRVRGSVRTMPIPGAAQWRQQPAICRLRGERLGVASNMRGDGMLCDAMRCTLRCTASEGCCR